MTMNKDDLGNRMKQYESCYQNALPRRSCIIIRLDGKTFSTLTKGMDRPMDLNFRECMNYAILNLCENIQGAKIAYAQSDEVSILLTDYEKLNTDPWFGNKLQKMVSISASMLTAYFNEKFVELFPDRRKKAFFDSRLFVLPKDDVCNYFIWRQKDCERNSIQSLARANFSDKQCFKKSVGELQDMLVLEKDVNWNDCLTEFKRGCAFYKKDMEIEISEAEILCRPKWVVDKDIPIFTRERNFIEEWVYYDQL